jgi:hypothetical protein
MQAGLIQKKEIAVNIQFEWTNKKKKWKNRKNLLTSMTTHIKKIDPQTEGQPLEDKQLDGEI